MDSNPANAILKGALYAVFGAFPMAAIMALVYRFPIPLAGYASGVEAVVPSLYAVVFYGFLGGFGALAVAGALGGYMAFRLGRPDRTRIARLNAIIPLIFTFVGTFVLATLDKIVGRW